MATLCTCVNPTRFQHLAAAPEKWARETGNNPMVGATVACAVAASQVQ